MPSTKLIFTYACFLLHSSVIERFSMVLHGLNDLLVIRLSSLVFFQNTEISLPSSLYFSLSLCLMLRIETFGMVVVVVVVMPVVVVMVVVLGILVLAFQQMLFSVTLTVSQGTKPSVISVQLHKGLQVTHLHLL